MASVPSLQGRPRSHPNRIFISDVERESERSPESPVTRKLLSTSLSLGSGGHGDLRARVWQAHSLPAGTVCSRPTAPPYVSEALCRLPGGQRAAGHPGPRPRAEPSLAAEETGLGGQKSRCRLSWRISEAGGTRPAGRHRHRWAGTAAGMEGLLPEDTLLHPEAHPPCLQPPPRRFPFWGAPWSQPVGSPWAAGVRCVARPPLLAPAACPVPAPGWLLWSLAGPGAASFRGSPEPLC